MDAETTRKLNAARQLNNEAILAELPTKVVHKAQKRGDGDTPIAKLCQREKRKQIDDPGLRYYKSQQRRPKEQHQSEAELVDALAADLQKRKEKNRKAYERATNYDISGTERVDFINDRNKRYNKALANAYDQYIVD